MTDAPTYAELVEAYEAQATIDALNAWAARRTRRRARLRWFTPWPLAVVDWPRSIPGGRS